MTTPSPRTTGRTYPVAVPPGATDDRFTMGLALDVAAVLEAHGYPAPAGLDMVDLQSALFRVLYVGETR